MDLPSIFRHCLETFASNALSLAWLIPELALFLVDETGFVLRCCPVLFMVTYIHAVITLYR